jgi:hypothetical protein
MRIVPTTLLIWLATTGAALAAEQEPSGDNGEGFAGETTDKVVTFFSLGVLIFFVLVVTLGTIIQSLLERRKERRNASHFQRYGW